MVMERKNVIVEKSIAFSLALIKFCELLDASKKFVISKQLLRSGTSIGANVIEAQNAESKKDFIHKMKIAAKEASETDYWLVLCEKSDNYPSAPGLRIELNEISRILTSIIGTAKRSLRSLDSKSLPPLTN